MSVEVYTDLDVIPADIASALSTRSGHAFFQSIEWFRCLAKYGIDDGTPRVYVAQIEGSTQCALYCLAQRRKLRSLTNFYTIEYGPVMNGPNADIGLKAIVSHISAERPRWDTIDFRNLQAADLRALTESMGSSEFAMHTWDQYKNWFLDVADRSFEQYYGQLSSKLRNTVARKCRKAEREHDLRLTIYPAVGVSLDEAITHFQKTYAESWKESEPFAEFMPSLFRICDENGLARVGMAWLDGQPAATQLWITDGNRSFIFKLAYDEKFKDLSIGSILSRALFAHAIDTDHVTEVDYGVGDEPYKRDWMSGSRQLTGLMACNRRTLRGQFANLRQHLSSLKASAQQS